MRLEAFVRRLVPHSVLLQIRALLRRAVGASYETRLFMERNDTTLQLLEQKLIREQQAQFNRLSAQIQALQKRIEHLENSTRTSVSSLGAHVSPQ